MCLGYYWLACAESISDASASESSVGARPGISRPRDGSRIGERLKLIRPDMNRRGERLAATM